MGLDIAEKPESMDLCFVTQGSYRDSSDSPARAFCAGQYCRYPGQGLGRHEGIAGYTIGQPQGFGFVRADLIFVVELQPDTATVVVGRTRKLLLKSSPWVR